MRSRRFLTGYSCTSEQHVSRYRNPCTGAAATDVSRKIVSNHCEAIAYHHPGPLPVVVNNPVILPAAPLALAQLVKSPDPALRLMAAKELAQYLYPKRKAVEHSSPDGEGMDVNVNIRHIGA